MRNFLDKIFFRSNNLNYISQDIKGLTKKSSANKIFDIINSYNSESEIRYVGGCIRKIINKENVDDIDLATNLLPKQVCEALKKENISYYETGIDHGTITAIIDGFTFEITTLRKDISTDGRHAKIKFSKDWKEDASRRDFTINSIYSDKDGNLFDPYNGKNDLENGLVNFIGEPDKRTKEDYLRILRYLRFFSIYSKHRHNMDIIRIIKINIGGISILSKERLLDELKKILKFSILNKISSDKLGLEIILAIFPELKNINTFQKLSHGKEEMFKDIDFIFLLSLLIIDETDNADYFLFKYNISKKDKKRIKIIDNFFKDKTDNKSFLESNMDKVLYYDGRQAVIDILNFQILKSKKLDNNLLELVKKYREKQIPNMPIGADILMSKYQIPEGKQLGLKLKKIEEEWVKNNFEISEKQVKNIIYN